MKNIEVPIQLFSKVTGKALNADEAAYALYQYFYPAHCVGLHSLAVALKLAGGENKLVKLLQDAGIVNRGATPEDECLPKQTFLEENYFKVRRRMRPGNKGLFTFYVTKKGINFVVDELKKIGVRVPEQYKKNLFFYPAAKDLKAVDLNEVDIDGLR